MIKTHKFLVGNPNYKKSHEGMVKKYEWINKLVSK
jgi:hypothetical protein